MLVKARMSKPVITIFPETPVQEAMALMRKENIRRLPVVDHHGKLVGIVSEKELLNASPSEATSLSVWEISYLLSKLTVDKVMSKKLVTVTEDTPLEEAARIMADNKVGGLPVVRDGGVVGIITETDLFKIFLEMLGARHAGIRISVLIKNVPGTLSELTRAIYQAGGNIVALGTFLGESSENSINTFKIEGVSIQALRQAIEPLVEEIIDIRETRLT
ncbi:MAG: CBS and ACT domain-containing protein [Anaerolineaceae bacterium]|nr:CBS and ACT domain-containing protein [Anaerolineaceae bacterium]